MNEAHDHPLEQDYLPFNGVLIPRERLDEIFCIQLSVAEGLTADAAFDCFGFFTSRFLLF
jgi:hypothetical protein